MDKIEINAATKLSIVIASAFSASLIILFGFACLSDFTNDWTWFSRSGSILVAIGISVTAYDIKGKMEMSNAPGKYVSQTIILEAAILIVGTLIWGFGDLVPLFIDSQLIPE